MSRRGGRRGLSYILSVVMMTLVTTSLASVVLLWGLGQVNESQSSFGLAIRARIDKTQERLVVENVEFVDNRTITVSMRNVGKVQIVIDQIYANHTALSLTPSKLVLGVQQNGNITATSSSDFVYGPLYVVVATSRGTTYADYYTYSQ
ncbi:MAG: hypothetical protein ACE5KU_01920 [Nitrososphaerales archaeon]